MIDFRIIIGFPAWFPSGLEYVRPCQPGKTEKNKIFLSNKKPLTGITYICYHSLVIGITYYNNKETEGAEK